jgi:EAL domain-containing protein (putative c-di-GMP-specific phosphodiesterase class I)
MTSISDTKSILQQVRALGIKISIDNFGTGYSSLTDLRKLSISELKIDHSLVKNIPDNEDDKAITLAIIALAKNLSLEVTAKGIENEQQVAFLRRHACDTAQGYFYSRPLPQDEFRQFIHHYK